MSTDSDLEVLDALLRDDFRAFVLKAFAHLHGEPLRSSWHVDLFAALMAEVFEGKTKRLALNAPPRSLKSFVMAVAYVAWLLGKQPRAKAFLVSHDDKLARAHADKVRLLLEADWYQRVFPQTRLRSDHNRAGDFQTTLGGHVFARSLEAGVTGHGADLIVFDDPHDAGDVQSAAMRDRAYSLVVEKYLSRLNSPATGAIVLIMQRLHPDDLTSRLVESGAFKQVVVPLICEILTDHYAGGEGWRRPVGNILDPERWGDTGLADLRRSMPTFVWSSQYQQSPVSPTSGVLEERFFTLVDGLPDLPYETYLSFDLAGAETTSGSYSVCAVIHRYGQNFYISQIWRGRLEFEALKDRALSLIRQHPQARVLIEDAALGPALISSLRAMGTRLVAIPRPTLSKLDRVLSVFDIFADGRVHLPRYEPWTPAFLEEAVQFPTGSHDDQIDAVVQCLRWLKEGKNSPPSPFRLGGPAARTGGPHPQRDPRQRAGANIMQRPRPSAFRNPRFR